MHRLRPIPLALAALLLAACGRPTGVATNPPVSGGLISGVPTAAASGGAQTSGTRTVLAELGLNIHDQPAVTAHVVATPARGAELTVLGYSADNGGWYQVKIGSSQGWITADPTLSAEGNFIEFASDGKAFSALYPASWTYSDLQAETVFTPQSGAASIVVRPAASRDALGSAGLGGYTQSGDQQVVVCGYTGDLVTYGGGPQQAQPTTDPNGGKVSRLALFAQIRLTFDSSHFLDLEYNYSSASDLGTFTDFYNGIVFPFSQCQQVSTPAPSPSASPT